VSDPTLATLVPSGTRRRNAALVTGGLLALVLAAFSTRVLQPQFANGSLGAGWEVGTQDRTVTAVITATPRVWPLATMTGVVAPPGTHVVGAWLLDADTVHGGEPAADLTGAGSPTNWQEALARLLPSGGADPSTALPRAAHGDRELSLAVVWRVDDCAALAAAQPRGSAALVRWRTVVGTVTTSRTTEDLGPAGEQATDLLARAGVCP
jgi:hypothetical protein